MAIANITVRGAGIFGLSIAYELQARGAKVTVVEPERPGAGSSGGLVGALAPHTPDNWNPKKAFQLASLVRAGTFWRDVERLSGLSSGYAPTGRLQPLADERAVELARAREKMAGINWQGRAVWTVMRDPGEWAPPSPSGYWVHDTLSALIHPRRAMSALAAAFAALGGTITQEDRQAPVEIWATGATGLMALGRELGRTVGNGVKGQALLVDHDAAGRAQLFADGIHIVPHLDGTVAIGSTSERAFTDPTTTDHLLDDLYGRAMSLFPALGAAKVLDRWAGVRPRALSRAPLLGPHPLRPGVYIANGGFKIGFGMAPEIARVMADLVLDCRDHIPGDFRMPAG